VHDLSPIALGLPHREPFIFVDEVLELTPGESAVCSKSFSVEEPFFRGHFPGDPIVPGVILTEALAQASGIAAGRAGIRRSFRLSAIRQMKFLRAVRPGETIRLKVEKRGEIGGLLQFSGAAEVEGATVAEGILVLSEVSEGNSQGS
jgi:3-hydroxyacyl-[acyl-carrier-protein] dehydratase